LVTLEELGEVPLDELRTEGPYGGAVNDQTLADYVYRTLWPTLLRYRDTGACHVALHED
jgi:hypothetical protein